MNLKKTMNSVIKEPTRRVNKSKEVEVTVSVTLSKTVKVKINDYDIISQGIDEDGNFFENIDYSNCNITNAVEEQVLLPQYYMKDWNVDDFECIIE